jgi:hypothetical protein
MPETTLEVSVRPEPMKVPPLWLGRLQMLISALPIEKRLNTRPHGNSADMADEDCMRMMMNGLFHKAVQYGQCVFQCRGAGRQLVPICIGVACHTLVSAMSGEGSCDVLLIVGKNIDTKSLIPFEYWPRR